MIANPESRRTRTDRNATVGFAAGMLGFAAVCMAVVPVPFTGYVCFPAAAVMTMVAVINGFRALRRFKALTATEKAMTIAGMIASAMTVLAAACSLVLLVALGLRLADALGQFAR